MAKEIMQVWIEKEIERILAMSDEQIMAEHLALYEGNEELANKSIDLLRTNIFNIIAGTTKH